MSCCKKPEGQAIPNLSGELKIWNEDSSITTISLSEKEVWVLRAIMKDAGKRAVNEPGFVNGEAKRVIVDLVEKIVPKEGGCGQLECCSGEMH